MEERTEFNEIIEGMKIAIGLESNKSYDGI
jgi:hypothetical protein